MSVAYITRELVDTCTAKLKKGKAAGPDDLSVEHIVYAHPSLCIAICNLFKLIITHRYVAYLTDFVLELLYL